MFRGLMVRLPGFHPGDPGSNPAIGNIFFLNLIFIRIDYLSKIEILHMS